MEFYVKRDESYSTHEWVPLFDVCLGLGASRDALNSTCTEYRRRVEIRNTFEYRTVCVVHAFASMTRSLVEIRKTVHVAMTVVVVSPYADSTSGTTVVY